MSDVDELFAFGEDANYGDGTPLLRWDLEATPPTVTRYYADGTPLWQRVLTQAEQLKIPAVMAARQALTVNDDLRQRLRLAKAANLAWLNRDTTPTVTAIVAQLDRVTRQATALINLQLQELTTDGT